MSVSAEKVSVAVTTNDPPRIGHLSRIWSEFATAEVVKSLQIRREAEADLG